MARNSQDVQDDQEKKEDNRKIFSMSKEYKKQVSEILEKIPNHSRFICEAIIEKYERESNPNSLENQVKALTDMVHTNHLQAISQQIQSLIMGQGAMPPTPPAMPYGFQSPYYPMPAQGIPGTYPMFMGGAMQSSPPVQTPAPSNEEQRVEQNSHQENIPNGTLPGIEEVSATSEVLAVEDGEPLSHPETEVEQETEQTTPVIQEAQVTEQATEQAIEEGESSASPPSDDSSEQEEKEEPARNPRATKRRLGLGSSLIKS